MSHYEEKTGPIKRQHDAATKVKKIKAQDCTVLVSWNSSLFDVVAMSIMHLSSTATMAMSEKLNF